MDLNLNLTRENVLTAQQTNALVNTLRTLTARAEKAESELEGLRQELAAASRRAENAEASLSRLREGAEQVLQDLTAPLDADAFLAETDPQA